MSHILRAARASDLQALYEMAKSTGGGFTNLPPDRKSLSTKLERAADAFGRAGDVIADDLFVFVLENTLTGDVRGTWTPNSAPNAARNYEAALLVRSRSFRGVPQFAG